MKYYLSSLIPRLKKYSSKLDQSSLLVDKPWVVSDNERAYEKLIFRNDGRVHLSKDGTVINGKWEYLSEAQSLLIDYGDEKKLYRHQYLDEAVLALKLDGVTDKEDYFLLANENVVPDNDAKTYLRNKYLEKQNIELIKLHDGGELELHKRNINIDSVLHARVELDSGSPKDGQYLLKGGQEQIVVRDSKVVDKKERVEYENDIAIWQSFKFPREGDYVEGLNEGEVEIVKGSKYKLLVEDNRISKVKDLELRNVTLFWVGFAILITLVVVIVNVLD